MHTLDSNADITHGITQIISHASHRIEILSSHLPSAVFNDEALINAVQASLRRSRLIQMRILLQDSAPLFHQHHGFLELIRRLPSKIQVRKLHDDDHDLQQGYVLADYSGHVYQANLKIPHGVMSERCRETVKRLNDEFLTLWGRSLVDEHFNQWII